MTERISNERLLDISHDPMAATVVEVILLIDEIATNRLNESRAMTSKVTEAEFVEGQE